MNRNVGIQNQGLIIWDGANNYARDIRRHTDFGFVFEVRGDLGADTIFKVMAHDPDPTDICAAGPAYEVPEVPICQHPAYVPADTTDILLPAGTPAGSICSATIPCRPAAFVSLSPVGGSTSNVIATIILTGPMF